MLKNPRSLSLLILLIIRHTPANCHTTWCVPIHLDQPLACLLFSVSCRPTPTSAKFAGHFDVDDSPLAACDCYARLYSLHLSTRASGLATAAWVEKGRDNFVQSHPVLDIYLLNFVCHLFLTEALCSFSFGHPSVMRQLPSIFDQLSSIEFFNYVHPHINYSFRPEI
jgi:hypothetical protein